MAASFRIGTTTETNGNAGTDIGGPGTPRLTPEQAAQPDRLPGFWVAARVWLEIGLLSFGGPAGQIAMLHREIVEQRKWVSERRFLHALSFCALLPGPEAQQLATYLGWLMHGVRGGVAAGTLFVLPGAAVMLILSIVFAKFGNVPAVDGLFFGLKCAVLAMVIQALIRVATRALKTAPAWAVAAGAFVALNLFSVPFPAVVFVAGLIGALFQRRFVPPWHGDATQDSPGLIDRILAADPAAGASRTASARVAGLAAMALWLIPVGLLSWLAAGRYATIAWFFSKMAIVTIGGAYAVLAYVAQDAVHAYHWLTAPEMLAGLGLAETTPGPLILVLQFVGFLAGFRAPGALTGLPGGIAGSALTLWVTFLPCFAFVFLGAPVMERLTNNRSIASALAAVTASVVGVIANLALWFSLHVLFAATQPLHWGHATLELPVPGTIQPVAIALAAVAALLLFGFRQSAPRTLAVCAALGLIVGATLKLG